jgi:hypothetical protein
MLSIEGTFRQQVAERLDPQIHFECWTIETAYRMAAENIDIGDGYCAGRPALCMLIDLGFSLLVVADYSPAGSDNCELAASKKVAFQRLAGHALRTESRIRPLVY